MRNNNSMNMTTLMGDLLGFDHEQVIEERKRERPFSFPPKLTFNKRIFGLIV